MRRGHVGSVEREIEKIKQLSLQALTEIYGSKHKAQNKIRETVLVYNLLNSLYTRHLIDDENLQPNNEEGSTG